MSNDQTKAVRMAHKDINTVITSFKEMGHFMDRPSPRTQAKNERISASPEAQTLLDQGVPQGLADRITRELKDG